MAFDAGVAETLRSDLEGMTGIQERRMFGGLCFTWNGNMLCGVHKSHGIFRVGKDVQDAALALDGVWPMDFTGRPMGGMVEAGDNAMSDDALRHELLGMARRFVARLPDK